MQPKLPLKIMVASGISKYKKAKLYVVPMGKNVNGKHYRQNILPIDTKIIKNRHVFSHIDMFVIMQDGATCHTARATLNKIEQTGVKVWIEWPGNSPDLNLKKHTWARLLESVLKEPRSKYREQFFLRIMEKRDLITQNDL